MSSLPWEGASVYIFIEKWSGEWKRSPVDDRGHVRGLLESRGRGAERGRMKDS